MMPLKRSILFAWGPVVLWLLVIFLFSAAPGDLSGAQSASLLDMLLDLLTRLWGPEWTAKLSALPLEFLLRKAAHFSEYAVLCLLARRAFRLSGARRFALCALFFSVFCAALDEGHQLFVPGRAGQPRDVLIDACGAAFGLLLAALCTSSKPS